MINISDWNKKPWFHTKGTREKWIVEDKLGSEFYFKTSIKREGRYYPFEFWSEVIASKLGEILCLPVLKYQVAISEDTIGCLCPSMLFNTQHLIEGIQYLQAYNTDFNPELNKKRASMQYSFQFIEDALTALGHSLYMKNIIEIIIFDSIIGNQDRHQENWGTIISYRSSGIMKKFSENPVDSHSHFLRLSGRNISGKDYVTREFRAYQDITSLSNLSFAPIYDNGSSLGRELDENRLSDILKNQKKFETYLRNGRSEIKWQGNQLSHIDLVKNILDHGGYADTELMIKKIVNRYDETAFEKTLDSICNDIPATFASFILTHNRKSFIVKLVTNRINSLKSLL